MRNRRRSILAVLPMILTQAKAPSVTLNHSRTAMPASYSYRPRDFLDHETRPKQRTPAGSLGNEISRSNPNSRRTSNFNRRPVFPISYALPGHVHPHPSISRVMITFCLEIKRFSTRRSFSPDSLNAWFRLGFRADVILLV